ncbi:MAG: AAA family ATPase, partial [Ruminococcaceae bacterium]|nr:AAA family ATPase [Oscillospiraceae bacterium]
MGELDADDFKYIPNRAVFEVCKELFMGGKPIDPVTVGSKYPHTGHLAEIINATPTTANLNYHIQAVADRAKRINAEKTTEELLKLLETEEITECQALVNKLSDTLAGNKRVEMLTMKDAIVNFYKTKRAPREYIRTGFSTLDKYTYIDRGDFIVLGGRPSAGKTAFTLQLGLNMAKQHKVLYFSLETKPDKLFDRVFSNLAEISLSQIKTGGDAMKIKEWNRYTANVPNMHNLNFTVIKASGMTVQQIKAAALELKADIIFIDYLSLIKSQGNSLYEKVTNISMDLHTMAQQTEMVVVALAQLNREGKGEPDVTNIRESGQIEQDADLILMIHQPDINNPERELIIAKNKEGRTGKIRFRFEGMYQKFWEMMA